jgi:flagellar secretion chaperone FliS
MSYSTRTRIRESARQGDRYKEMEVLSASPGELVVMVYDHLLASLLRARVAIAAGDHETRIESFAKARDAVGELLATLDRAKGGAVAGQLGGLYTFFLRELAALGIDPAVDRLDRVTAMVRELREAFVGIQKGAVR